MWFLITLSIFAAFVTWRHGVFLNNAQTKQNSPVQQRQILWKKHLQTNGVLWLVLFVAVGVFQWTMHEPFTSFLRFVLGTIFFFLGIFLVVWVRLLLGKDQAMGVRFFFPERFRRVHGGPFRWLHNPMYDGFILILLSGWLMFGVWEDIVLAVVSFFLLNMYLARIENKGIVS